jgi:hypothetical protein
LVAFSRINALVDVCCRWIGPPLGFPHFGETFPGVAGCAHSVDPSTRLAKMTRSAARVESMNVDQLRWAIDRGRTGDKVAYPDPAAAPLGTDEEAAGTPISAWGLHAGLCV